MSELNKRHILDFDEQQRMIKLKANMSSYIRYFKTKGIRSANIEIELLQHIKKELNKSE